MRLLLASIFAVSSLATMTGSALALTGSKSSAPVESASEALPVATLVCTRDDRGWRYMRGDRRVTCRPARPRGAEWIWRSEGGRSGWWHRRDNRWND